jgi:hypothetical protein
MVTLDESPGSVKTGGRHHPLRSRPRRRPRPRDLGPIAGRDRCLSDIAFCFQVFFFEMLATSDPRDPWLSKCTTNPTQRQVIPKIIDLFAAREDARPPPWLPGRHPNLYPSRNSLKAVPRYLSVSLGSIDSSDSESTESSAARPHNHAPSLAAS